MKTCTTCGTRWPDDTKFCPNDGSTLRSAEGADLIGSVLADRYHVTRKLGEGGMGTVYLGEHVKMGRKSAIKVMSKAMAQDTEAIARFNREAANAARINHPNVCAIYDFGETKEGVIYLAMEFIEGESLTDLLEREGALAPRRAAGILRQAGEALQAAHDLGIVHRDLKPDNIMIARGRDGSDLVKVVDFGIAKAMSGDEGQKVTKTGLVVGTPEYMSPEQLAGDRLDGRSDIYSLALVFYRTLTDALPFQAETSQEMMVKRLTDDPVPLNSARPGAGFPATLQRVMDRALQRMPADRYTSAAELARDAVAAVSQMGDAAPTPVDTQAATQILSRAAATDVARTRVSAGRTATPDTPVPVAATRAAGTPARRNPAFAIAATVAVLAAGGGTAAILLRGRGEVTAAVPDSAGQRSTTADTTQPVATRRAPEPERPVTRTDPVVSPPEERGIPVNLAAADTRLTTLLDRLDPGGQTPPAIATAVRDTALAYYSAAGMTPKDQALAAYVVANAHAALENRSEALRWAQTAARLDGTSRAYQALVSQFVRPE